MPDEADIAPFGFSLPMDDWMTIVQEARAPAPLGNVGDYQLLDEVSRGGQGVVYRARHSSTGQIVALKRMLDGNRASTSDRLRFEREMETASRINHPNLVSLRGRIAAAGVTYLVMDWIDGVPINRWPSARDGEPRSQQEIVELFIAVGEAVHHAHQRGVIHRDLKPSNILVDAADRPHVLDFGLARTLQDEANVTAAGQFVGTLAYASPEQLRGDADANDILTDVYALGVILYEMLTGRLPHDRSSRLGKVIHGLERESVVRPTTVVPQLKRDLEAIVLKALAKNKAQRYQSVEAFVGDLRRHAAGEPVLARPPSHFSFLVAALRRNRLLAAFALTVFVLVVGFAAVATVQRNTARTAQMRESSERLRATEQARKATALSEFVRDMFASIDPRIARGRDVSLMRSILDRTVSRIDSEFAGQLESLAEIHSTVGLAYRSIGEFDRSHSHLMSAMTTWKRIPDASPAAIAKSVIDLAELQHIQGRYADSEALFREAAAMLQVDRQEDIPIASKGSNGLAKLLVDLGRFDEAERLFGESLSARRRLDAVSQASVAETLNDLGKLLTIRGRHDEAGRHLAAALEIRRSQLDRNAPEIAETLTNVAAISVERGDYPSAVPRFEEALAIYREYLGDDHLEVASLKSRLAEALWHVDRNDEAVRFFNEALTVGQKALGPKHAIVAGILNKLGELQAFGLFDYEAAESTLGRAIAIQRELFGNDNLDVAQNLHNLATIAYTRRNYESAEAQFIESLRIREKLLGSNHNLVASSRFFLAHILFERTEYAKTVEQCRLAIESWTTGLTKTDPRVIGAMSLMAKAELRLGHPEKAEPLLRQALEIHQKDPGTPHFSIIAFRITLGTCLIDLGKYDEAESLLQTCLKEAESDWGHKPELIENIRGELARLKERRGN